MIIDNLPETWTICQLDDVIVKMSNGANVIQYDEKVGYPISRIETIWNENIDLERVKYVKETNPDFIDKYALQCGDILLSHINSDSHLGKTGIFKKQVEVLIHGINFLLIRPSTHISSDFLNYQFKHLRTKGIFINAAQRAVNQSSINQQKLKSFQIIIPPLPEQHRIVAKIEALFSELDKGIESFKTARKQLKIYRQALLKHAFSGKLTAQWRAENQDKLETAEALLQRIQAEREQRYQQQLKDWENKSPSISLLQRGKPTRATLQTTTQPIIPPFEKGGLGGIYKLKAPKPLPPLTAQELAGLPELPTGLAWTRLGNTNVEVSDGPFGSNLKSSDYVDSGVRVVRLENIGALEFIEEKESYVTEEKYDLLKRHTVSAGDIIFSSFITENVRVALLPPTITKAINKADCFCVRFFGESLSNVFVMMFLSTRQVYKQLEALIHGVGRPRINTTQLKDVVVPVCSAAEQKVIIAEIESRLSEVDQLDQTLTTALQLAEALRQSILKKAFSGQLVPQDPNDEPATCCWNTSRPKKAALVTPIKIKNKRQKGTVVKVEDKLDYLRIQEVKRQEADNPGKTLEQVKQELGFTEKPQKN